MTVSGLMIKCMAKGYFIIRMVIAMLASMRMISSMVKVFIILIKEADTKANGKKAGIMVKVQYIIAMVM